MKVLGYAEYYALIHNPEDAYHELESGILDAHDKIEYLTEAYKGNTKYAETLEGYVEQNAKALILQGRLLMSRYPDMGISAKRSFTRNSFVESIKTHGADAENIEKARITVYRQLVDEEQAQDAEREFSEVFNIPLTQ
jgi:hypothetical protein